MSTQETTRLASSTGSENSHTPVATSIDHEKEGIWSKSIPAGRWVTKVVKITPAPTSRPTPIMPSDSTVSSTDCPRAAPA